MKITTLTFAEVLVIEPEVYQDSRGCFYESFNHAEFESATGLTINFVQDNHSLSYQHVLRGLHYQLPPKAQGKLIRIVEGEVRDVVVDIRRSSPTFGQWVSVILSAANGKQLWVPAGFAHGFVVLSKQAQCCYKVTEYYSPFHERCITWNDPDLNIQWNEQQHSFLMSAKDQQGKSLKESEVFD